MSTFAAFASAGFGSARDTVSKRLATKMEAPTSAFASFVCSVPYYILLLAVLVPAGREVVALTPVLIGLVALRAASDTVGESLKMAALARGDLSVVAAFSSLSPLFVLCVSPFVTGDHLSGRGIVGVCFVVTGSSLLAAGRRENGTGQRRAILFATGSALFFAVNACVDRVIVRHATPVFAGLLITCLSSAALFPVATLRAGASAGLVDHRRPLLLRGALELGYMATKLLALETMPAPYVVGLQRAALLVSVIAGRVFFKEEHFPRKLLAGACVLAGLLFIAFSG